MQWRWRIVQLRIHSLSHNSTTRSGPERRQINRSICIYIVYMWRESLLARVYNIQYIQSSSTRCVVWLNCRHANNRQPDSKWHTSELYLIERRKKLSRHDKSFLSRHWKRSHCAGPIQVHVENIDTLTTTATTKALKRNLFYHLVIAFYRLANTRWNSRFAFIWFCNCIFFSFNLFNMASALTTQFFFCRQRHQERKRKILLYTTIDHEMKLKQIAHVRRSSIRLRRWNCASHEK